MLIDPENLDPQATYKLLTGVVVPRPIAWVTTVTAAGGVNLAPFSAFTFVSSKPPMVGINVGRKAGVMKDTGSNILRTGEYVIHVPDTGLLEAVHQSSVEHPADVSEVELLGLQTIASRNVSPQGSIVVTVAQINAGTASNVIPRELTFIGTMRTIRRETRELGRKRFFEIAQQTAGVKARLDASRAREKGLRTKLAYLEESAIVLRDLGARYELLKNDVESAENLYRTLVKQAMETAVNAQLAASNVRVIERAEVPEHPSRPNVPLNLALGLALAMGVSVVATIVCDARLR